MEPFKFDFNPITPVPSGGGGTFPWKPALIGFGLLAIIIAIAYAISKPGTEESPSVLDEELPDDKIP